MSHKSFWSCHERKLHGSKAELSGSCQLSRKVVNINDLWESCDAYRCSGFPLSSTLFCFGFFVLFIWRFGRGLSQGSCRIWQHTKKELHVQHRKEKQQLRLPASLITVISFCPAAVQGGWYGWQWLQKHSPFQQSRKWKADPHVRLHLH